MNKATIVALGAALVDAIRNVDTDHDIQAAITQITISPVRPGEYSIRFDSEEVLGTNPEFQTLVEEIINEPRSHS